MDHPDATPDRPTLVLMVCLGNICRSPTAEAALREAADRAGLAVEVDSAGTARYHVGSPPDPRTVRAAREAGLELTSVARQVSAADFERFDLLVAMDADNREDLRRLARSPADADRVVLLRDFTDRPGTDVPDPYQGGPEGFVEVVRIAREGAAGLVRHLMGGSATRW